MMDRAEADMMTRVNRACRGKRICPQCLTLTEDFAEHQCAQHREGLRRHLDTMLVLADELRQAHSWLCQGPALLHGPLAMSVVDPSVVRLDFRNVPADRWHGVINMVDAITGCVRKTLAAAKLAGVKRV